MTKSLEDDRFKGVTIREAIKRTVWARNIQLTINGYSPLEIATGRRPPDLLDIETSDPALNHLLKTGLSKNCKG